MNDTEPVGPILIGAWPADDLRRAFVSGAAWWEYRGHQGTMWQSDVRIVELEAERRYPGGILSDDQPRRRLEENDKESSAIEGPRLAMAEVGSANRLSYTRFNLERRLRTAGCTEVVTLYHGYARMDGFFEPQHLRIIADAIEQARAGAASQGATE